MTSEASEERMRVRALVAECIERMEREGDAAVEAVCAAHPSDAAAIRARLSVLVEIGLVNTRGEVAAAFPERLGDFRLLRCLGGGGMGVVYLARQESLDREVALKLVHPEQLYFPNARERFQREAHAIARLQHPAIVPIYSFGEENGVPYFAMERIDGLGLDAVLQRLAGRPPAGLDGAALGALFGLDAESSRRVFGGSWVEACLRIVRQVAEALEHAHERGVVHRDVKPSNVMLTRDGRAHLFDFGLSSAREASRITKSGALLGSLPYLPPERVRGEGEPGAAGDVYSLGVTLYELLALALPFTGGTAEAMRGAILRGEPPPLPAINPTVPWDAETVCVTAFERDPARRYASAAAFARDLGHVLALQPIEARRAGWRLRARRWVQRHPTRSVALAAALLGVLVLPTALLLQQHSANVRIRKALDAETDAKHETERQRDQAKANYLHALDAIDVFLKRVGDERLAHVPQMEQLRRDLLEQALRFYRQLLAEGHGDVFLRRETAKAGTKLVAIELELGMGDAAREELAARIGMLDAAVAAAPDEVELQYALALAWSDLGRVQSRQEALADALVSYGASIDRFTRVVARRADDGESERQLAHAVGARSETLTRMGRTGEAIADGVRAAELLEKMVKREPDDLTARFELGRTLNYLGTSYEDEDRLDEALATFQRAERELGSCVQDTGRRDETCLEYYAIALHYVGMQYLRARAFGDAEKEFREAVRIRQKLADDYPAIEGYRWDLGESRMDLGETLRGIGRREEAAQEFAQALAIQQALVRDEPGRVGFRSELAATISQQADMQREDGELEAARDRVQYAIGLQKECLAKTPADPDCLHFMLRHQIVLGRVLAELREFDGAVEAFRAALPCCGRRSADRRDLAFGCAEASAQLEGDVELDEAAHEARAHELAAVACEALAPLGGGAAALLDAAELAPLKARPELATLRAPAAGAAGAAGATPQRR